MFVCEECVQVCVCSVFVCVYMRLYVCTCVHVCMCVVCVHMCMCVMFVCVVCVCVYLCVFVCGRHNSMLACTCVCVHTYDC